MNAAEHKSEKALEIIFVILLFMSLICFAGIPALEQQNVTLPIIKSIN
jgi:hypothetical protein